MRELFALINLIIQACIINYVSLTVNIIYLGFVIVINFDALAIFVMHVIDGKVVRDCDELIRQEQIPIDTKWNWSIIVD